MCSVNVWGGLITNKLIGPHVFTDRLNSSAYGNILTDNLPVLLKQKLTAEKISDIIHQHDNAPENSARKTQNTLNEIFYG